MKNTALFLIAMYSYNAFAIDFKGFELGGSEAAFVEKWPYYICPVKQEGKTRNCIASKSTYCKEAHPKPSSPCVSAFNNEVTYGGRPVNSIMATFSDDQLASITVFASSDHYDEISTALKQKIKAPVSRTSEALTNRMGVKFENEKLTWAKDDWVITVEKYAGKVTDMMVTINTKKFIMELQQRVTERKKKAADDL